MGLEKVVALWMLSRSLCPSSTPVINITTLLRETLGATSILHIDASFKNPKEMSEEQHRPPPGWRERTAYKHVMHESFRMLYALDSISYIMAWCMSIGKQAKPFNFKSCHENNKQ